jgi:hypothetical protein
MRGSLKQRLRGSWSIILDLGYAIDPDTGQKKRQQRYQTLNGTRKQAEDTLADLLKAVKEGEYIDPSSTTLGQWLTTWIALSTVKDNISPAARLAEGGQGPAPLEESHHGH